MEERAEGNRSGAAPAGLRLPIVANLLLLFGSLAVVSIGVYFLSQQATSAIRFESRFITAEWRLLAELKERTDRLLQARDREIAFLQARLLSIVRQGASETERRSLTSQLEQAYLERSEIMELRINPPPAIREQRPEAEGGVDNQTPGPEVVEELVSSSRFQVSDEPLQPEMLAPGEKPALAWYRRILADLTAGGPESASRRLERALGGVGGLSERDRSTLSELVDGARERQELRERLTTLDGELAQARSETEEARTAAEKARAESSYLTQALSETAARADAIEQQLSTVSGELVEAVSEAREHGRETGETQALSWSRLLLDYLAGEQIDSPEAARQRLIDLWEEEEEYRELIVQAQRLANAGIAEGRNDLPSQLLVGYVRSIYGEIAEVEVLTDVTLSPGDSVQIRQRSDIPPGGLVVEAAVLQQRGNTMRIRIEAGAYNTPRTNQLVYVSSSYRRE
ncbi:MAG: hypothetical protein ACOC25_03230 [Alkalispirochaetaceae bacterium]